MAPRTKTDTTAAAADDAPLVDYVVAIWKITYGEANDAEPGTIFRPVTETERGELFDLKAVRELTVDEAKLFANDPATVVEPGSGPAPAQIPVEKAADTPEPAAEPVAETVAEPAAEPAAEPVAEAENPLG